MPGVQFAWEFRPCTELAGDSLNVFSLGPKRVGLYVLDVTGHGVAASLLAVAASRLLSVIGGSDSPDCDERRARDVRPAEVAERLNESLPCNPATEQFLTLFYAVLDVPARLLTYVSAGHPGGIYLSRSDGPRSSKGPASRSASATTTNSTSSPWPPATASTSTPTASRKPWTRGTTFSASSASSKPSAGAPRSTCGTASRPSFASWTDGTASHRRRDDISVLAMQCD